MNNTSNNKLSTKQAGFLKYIVDLQQGQKISNIALATALGVDSSLIAKWKSGDRVPHSSLITRAYREVLYGPVIEVRDLIFEIQKRVDQESSKNTSTRWKPQQLQALDKPCRANNRRPVPKTMRFNLKEWMEREQRTNLYLAAILKVSGQSVNNWFNGKNITGKNLSMLKTFCRDNDIPMHHKLPPKKDENDFDDNDLFDDGSDDDDDGVSEINLGDNSEVKELRSEVNSLQENDKDLRKQIFKLRRKRNYPRGLKDMVMPYGRFVDEKIERIPSGYLKAAMKATDPKLIAAIVNELNARGDLV